MSPSNGVLCAPVRSAIGSYGATLMGMHVPELVGVGQGVASALETVR